MLTRLVKLEKLKIRVYGNRLRAGLPKSTFEVMFNPTSLSTRHRNVYHQLPGINSGGQRATYAHTAAEVLNLRLVIDGTGVTDFGLTKLIGRGTASVAKQIDEFLAACFYVDGDIHEPKFLKIQWGEGPLSGFDCRLQSVDTTYTSFAKSGAPLRAELATTFREDLEPKKRLKRERKSSPDVTHTHVVRSGDTLPLLCHEIYGSAEHYLHVAHANDLDDFRSLSPGQTLIFPPLAG